MQIPQKTGSIFGDFSRSREQPRAYASRSSGKTRAAPPKNRQYPTRQSRACPTDKHVFARQAKLYLPSRQSRICPTVKPAPAQQARLHLSSKQTRVYPSDEILLLLFPPSAIIIASSGFSEVWYRAWFGTKRPWVQVPQPGPKRRGCSASSPFWFPYSCCGT